MENLKKQITKILDNSEIPNMKKCWELETICNNHADELATGFGKFIFSKEGMTIHNGKSFNELLTIYKQTL